MATAETAKVPKVAAFINAGDYGLLRALLSRINEHAGRLGKAETTLGSHLIQTIRTHSELAQTIVEGAQAIEVDDEDFVGK